MQRRCLSWGIEPKGFTGITNLRQTRKSANFVSTNVNLSAGALLNLPLIQERSSLVGSFVSTRQCETIFVCRQPHIEAHMNYMETPGNLS
jgi:hypothetical protein